MCILVLLPSKTSTVAGGFAKYVHFLKVETCLNAHKFRRLDLSGIGTGIVANLVLNGTTEASATLAGQLTPTGQCQGVQYTDSGITYEDVVVIATISIKLMDYTATANVDEDAVTLRTGTICRYTEKYCFDDQAGEVTWEANPIDRCSATGIDVLYEGPSTVLVMNKSEANTVQYVIVETQDTVFALKLTSIDTLCQQPARRTEQNRLLIIFENSLGFIHRKSPKMVHNIDLMAQVLTKMLFLEIAVKQQMRELLYDSIIKRCRLREKFSKIVYL